MKLPRKSKQQAAIDIAEYYAVKPGSIWRGLKLESAAFWWLCIYVFFEYVRPQAIYSAIDIIPWGQIAVIATFVTALLDSEVKWVRSPANTLVILFTVHLLVSSVFALSPSIAFEKIDIPLVWFTLYFLIITILNTEKRFFVFLLLFLLVNFKMSQFGFISYANRGFSYASWGLSGSPGWFQNAGDFGIQMVIFAPLATAFILALKDYWGRYKKWFFYLLPLTALVSVVGTASRGAQLGVLATGLWFLFKSRLGFRAFAGILITGLLLYAILPEKMIEEYTVAGEDETSETRLLLWSYGMDVVRDNPFLGVGHDNWTLYCSTHHSELTIKTGDYFWCIEAHNTYIEAASELGLIGLVLLLLNLLVIFILNGRTRANAKQAGNRFIWYMAHGLDGGLVGCMVSSIFFSILFYPMFWVQLAMTVALNELSKKQLRKSTDTLSKT
jgi:O-antigen ligase